MGTGGAVERRIVAAPFIPVMASITLVISAVITSVVIVMTMRITVAIARIGLDHHRWPTVIAVRMRRHHGAGAQAGEQGDGKAKADKR